MMNTTNNFFNDYMKDWNLKGIDQKYINFFIQVLTMRNECDRVIRHLDREFMKAGNYKFDNFAVDWFLKDEAMADLLKTMETVLSLQKEYSVRKIYYPPRCDVGPADCHYCGDPTCSSPFKCHIKKISSLEKPSGNDKQPGEFVDITCDECKNPKGLNGECFECKKKK